MKIIDLDWVSQDELAHAQTDTKSAWVERTRDPDFERWLWTIDWLEGCVSEDQETALIRFGIESTKALAIQAAEHAVKAA
ncbi:MAG: hypothetical protein KJ947_10360 [Alphaproteobacteria bacterium]|nr:hypothetical protein [Alphaproteobacteria bacterium]MBU1549961.1 hypothetical protein [Alphaproteobacteria bacterium]MBU2336583.1 hypothetical protein [Alphaproteobacteria bacterium]MBU2387316.1 hypothetical protein [Alphaproteobacteria bacterium]